MGGAPAERVVRACLGLSYDGEIWPVNPRRRDMAGVPCFPSLHDLPGVPDAVFLGVNRHASVDAMRTIAGLHGVGGVVCYGSGFAESGSADLQDALLEAAGDLPFLGPNCYGYVNTFDRVALWPDEHGCGVFDRGVAIVSQSGNVACNLTYAQRGVRLGGMGLMDELPLERMWRDTRVDRIWDGTSEIQRHIISRAMLRAHDG